MTKRMQSWQKKTEKKGVIQMYKVIFIEMDFPAMIKAHRLAADKKRLG